MVGAFAGARGFASGGIWFGIAYFIFGVVGSFLTLQLLGLTCWFFRSSRMKCPCGNCRNDDYKWIGDDGNLHPVAKYACGKIVVLKDGKCEEFPEDDVITKQH